VLCVAYNYFISKDRDEKSGNTVGWKWFKMRMEILLDGNGWMRMEILLYGNGLG